MTDFFSLDTAQTPMSDLHDVNTTYTCLDHLGFPGSLKEYQSNRLEHLHTKSNKKRSNTKELSERSFILDGTRANFQMQEYNGLRDSHLKGYLHSRMVRKVLVKNELISKRGEILEKPPVKRVNSTDPQLREGRQEKLLNQTIEGKVVKLPGIYEKTSDKVERRKITKSRIIKKMGLLIPENFLPYTSIPEPLSNFHISRKIQSPATNKSQRRQSSQSPDTHILTDITLTKPIISRKGRNFNSKGVSTKGGLKSITSDQLREIVDNHKNKINVQRTIATRNQDKNLAISELASQEGATHRNE